MTTDTPRTDAFCIELPATNFDCDCWSQVIAIASHARELERELAEYIDENIKLWAIADCQEELERELTEAKTKVEKLTGNLKKAENLIRKGYNGWQKAEAEVERLRAILHTYRIPS